MKSNMPSVERGAVARVSVRGQNTQARQFKDSGIRSVLRKAVLLASVGVVSTGLSQAPDKEESSITDTNKLDVHGLVLNADALGKVNTMGTMTESFMNLGEGRSLTAVAGEYNLELATKSGDFGLKYEDGSSLFRGTIRYDRDRLGRLDPSFGSDTEASVTKNLTFLGDISDVTMGNPAHLDFGAGPQIKFGNNSVFALYSDRDHISNYRAGYMFDTRSHFFSVLADYTAGTDPVITGYYSTPYTRFAVSYDPNSETLFSGTLLAFGNNQFVQYVTEGFFKEQFVLTTKNRSVPDSDYTYIFPSYFFLDPKERFSDVFRLNVTYSLRTENVNGGLVDNAVMMRTRPDGSGVIFTQYAYKNTDITGIQSNLSYYGVGLGYRVGHLPNFTTILNVHSRGFRVDLALNF